MNRKKNIVFPRGKKIIEEFGEDLKLARKRRKLTTKQVAERAGITRTTLYKIEKGDYSVSFGAYFNVMVVLHLEKNVLELAKNDILGRKLQDIELLKSKT